MVRKVALFLLLSVWPAFICFWFNQAHTTSIHITDLRLIECGLLLFIVLSAIGLGQRLFSLFKIEMTSAVEECIFSLALGMGGLSLIMLGLGLCGLLYNWVAYALLAVILLLSRWLAILHVLRQLYLLARHSLETLSLSGLISAGLISIILALCLILTVVPTITFDSLVYHLAIPSDYISCHRITLLEHNLFSNYPLNTEMLFTLALLLKGDTLAKAVHLLFGLLSGLTIYGLSRRHLGQPTSWLSVLIFTTMPLVYFIAPVALNDFSLTFYELTSVYALLNYLDGKDRSWLLLSGVLCGLALGVKYLAGLCLLIMTLGILFLRWRQRPIKELFLFLIFSLLPLLPWLIKNAVLVHNPIYPFLFGGLNWNELLNERYYQEMSSYRAGISILTPFTSFWNISLNWISGSRPQLPVGPLFLAYLPFLFFLRSIDNTIKYITVFCSLFYLVWAYTCAADRFIIPCFCLLSIPVAYIINQLRQRHIHYYYLSLGLIFLVLGLNIYSTSRIIWKNSYFLPLQSSCTKSFLLEKSPAAVREYYQAIDFINQHLRAEDKVLFIGEVRSYYCQKRVLVNSQFDSTIIVDLIRQSSNLRELLERLHQQGVTHILVNEGMGKWLQERFGYFHWQSTEEVNLYRQFMTQALTKLYEQGQISIYKLRG